MSQILDFFCGNPNPDGLTIQHVLDFSDERFDAQHDFIQWLFPSREKSNFNDKAPLLTEDDIEKLKFEIQSNTDAGFNVLDGIERFMIFLGIEDIWWFNAFDRFEEANNFHEREHLFWVFNHNHLRITRMLKFLVDVGMDKYASDFVTFVKATAEVHGKKLPENSLLYWEDAVKYKF